MSNQQHAPERDPKWFFAAAAVALAMLVVSLLVASELAAGMFRSWNDVRLAPSAGLLHGYELYYAPGDSGPIWSWIYGPVAPLVYLPAVLAPTPASAVALGLAMTGAIFLLSLAGLHAVSCRSGGLAWAAGLTVLVLYSLAEPALRGAGYWIHADAPAIGFAAIACASIATQERRARRGALALCAVACVLAVASKQLLLPLCASLAIHLAWTEGRRRFVHWLGWLAGSGALTAAGFAAWLGWDALVFNAVTVPLDHPWKWGGGARSLATGAGELAAHAAPLVALLAFDRQRLRGQHDWRDHPRTLLVLTALALAPAAVLTRVKIGADENANAFALVFLAIAAIGALCDACTRPRDDSHKLARGMLGGLLVIGTLLQIPTLGRMPELWRQLPRNPETTGFALALTDPGTIYFPAHPLIALYAEGRASHVSYGLYDRDLAGYPVAPPLFHAFTARKLERVALWGSDDDHSLRQLPTFTRRTQPDPATGWVFAQPASEATRGSEPDRTTQSAP